MRILFVTFGSSIHTARWISQLKDRNWDIHLFPVDEYYLHPELENLTVHRLFKHNSQPAHSSVRQSGLWWPFNRGRARIKRLLGDPVASGAGLAGLITRLKPDVVHSMDMQGGLLAVSARKKVKREFPPWIHSSWGSDLFYFGKQAEYAGGVRSMIESCDYLTADCERELRLAPEFGFSGELLGVFSAAGGFHTRQMQTLRESGPPSSRRMIMLKGRQGHLGGRALFGLQALHESVEHLSDYEVAIYMANDIIPSAAKYISHVTGLRFRLIPEHTPHAEMLRLMGRARVAIGLGMTDGTPHAMLEAMVMGAFPIQSDTADTGGWIEDGKNGLLVPPEDPEAIAAAIQRAVSDDAMVDRAAEINSQFTAERIDIGVIQPKVVELYNKVAVQGRIKKRGLDVRQVRGNLGMAIRENGD